MMTIEEVRQAVQAVKDKSDDAEVAHGAEDALHQNVLDEIANGNPNAVELAREALKTIDLNFARWCA